VVVDVPKIEEIKKIEDKKVPQTIIKTETIPQTTRKTENKVISKQIETKNEKNGKDEYSTRIFDENGKLKRRIFTW